ncbi:hypothetical protein K402DRAFT_395815 [Aulographum hederae CBS 113979]|uniref:Uncharacterized protein n=1 Tax=Aulographum hederae CBS 113979 TaxID=1176131 RepID=A0A6G1GU42_9PEZI|nr:hypothetical protein K402DRAFT_395815 [Aulographum hederae CBS 113979]
MTNSSFHASGLFILLFLFTLGHAQPIPSTLPLLNRSSTSKKVGAASNLVLTAGEIAGITVACIIAAIIIIVVIVYFMRKRAAEEEAKAKAIKERETMELVYLEDHEGMKTPHVQTIRPH